MELNKHICIQLLEKEKEFMQMTLDDDYIVRDNKPDVLKIIYSKGDVVLEDIKVGNQVVWLTGKLLFSVLYQSDDENHRLETVNGEIPFQEKVIMDTEDNCEEISAKMQIEDLSIGILNSRKLVVRAVLNAEIQCLDEKSEAFTCAISAEGYEQKTEEINMLCLVENRKDFLQLQKEILLPNSRTNIGTVVFYQVDFVNEEIQLHDDKMHIQTNAKIWILYRSESTGSYECFETLVPLSGEIAVYGLTGDEIFWTKVRAKDVSIEARSDYDGENRMFGVELTLEVEFQIYREALYEILMDAYSMKKEVLLEREQTSFHQLLVKNISNVRLMEQQQLEPKQEKILQICGSSGKIIVDSVERKEHGVLVEGVLDVDILYTTIDDNMPFAYTKGQISFEQFVEIPGFSEAAKLWTEYKIGQLQVNLLDSTEYEIKAMLEIGILAIEENHMMNIVGVEEEELDMTTIQSQPGMIGYIRKDGEGLWDIAKKYHANAENILEIGNRVLVVKKVQ